MANLMDEREEQAIRRELEDLWRHLHEATAEVFGVEPFPRDDPEPLGIQSGTGTGAVAGDALDEALAHVVNRLDELEGGHAAGWSYRAARQLLDVCEALLRRHARWDVTGSSDPDGQP
jgi:hypothetical protein